MTIDNNQFDSDDAMDLLKELTIQDFWDVGLNQIAYIKKIEGRNDAGNNIFSVHAADGSQLSVKESYDTAIASIRINDLFPVTVH